MSTQTTLVEEKAKPYHHGDLRQTLLAAACRHIAAEGTEKLSLRALAREAGVSPTAPYRHFATKNSLLAAIAAEGFAELREQLDQYSREADQEPLAQLAASGRAYVNYAQSEPVKFNLMFGDVLADFSEFQDLQHNASTAFDRVVTQVKRAQAAGLVEDAPFEEIAAYLWSSMHGTASLLISKAQRLDTSEQAVSMDVIRYMRENLDAVINRIVRGLVNQPRQ